MYTQTHSIQTKKERFRFNKRRNEIETYKQHIRRQMVFRNTINEMITKIPTKEVSEVQAWSRHFYDLLSAFQIQKNFCFAEARAVQLFLMVKRFPNLFTLRTLKEAMKMFTVQAIHQITTAQSPFTFFEQILKHPQDYVKRSISQQNFEVSTFEIETQIAKEVLEIIALMWAKSDATRNFTLNFGQPVNRYIKTVLTYKEQNLLNPFLKILSASTNFSWGKNLNPQYKLIVKNLYYFLKKFSQEDNFKNLLKDDIFFTRNIIEIFKTLCKLYQMKEEWVFALVEEQGNFRILTQAIQFHLKQSILMGNVTQYCSMAQQYFCHPQNIKYIYQIICEVENLIMHIQQKSVKQIRNMSSILRLLLELMKIVPNKRSLQLQNNRFSCQNAYFHKIIDMLNPSRKKSYFIISNLICVNQQLNGKFQNTEKKYVQMLVYQYNLIDILAENILIQTQDATIYDLVYLIGSIVDNIISQSQSSSFLNSVHYRSMLRLGKFQDYGYTRQNMLSQLFQQQKAQILQELGPSKQSLIFLINSSKLVQNTFERIIEDDFLPQQCKALFFGCIQNYLHQYGEYYKNTQSIFNEYQKITYFDFKIQAIQQFKERLLAYAQSPKCNKFCHDIIAKFFD